MENKFDEIIKKAALEHEEAYKPEYWDAFEKKLNIQSPKETKSIKWLKIAAGTAIIAVTATFVFYHKKIDNSINQNTSVTEKILTHEQNQSGELITEKSSNLNTKAQVEPKVNLANVEKMKENKSEFVKSSQIIAETKATANKEEKELSSVKQDNKSETHFSTDINSVKPTIELKKNIYCEGEAIVLNALNVPENCMIVWDMGDGKNISKKQTSYVYANPGNYTLTLNCYSDKKLIHSETTPITVVANPKADFDWTDKHENEIEENYTIAFMDKSYDAVKWEWNFGDKITSNLANPVHTYKTQGNYAVTLTVTNQFGCKEQKTQFIDVKDQNPLLAPNSFSPNGDGINDYFIPKRLENANINFELKILDRTGKLIYQTNDSNKPWNGRYNNSGELLNNNGTPFIWMVTITSDDGKIKRFNGTINIVN